MTKLINVFTTIKNVVLLMTMAQQWVNQREGKELVGFHLGFHFRLIVVASILQASLLLRHCHAGMLDEASRQHVQDLFHWLESFCR